MTERTCSVDGCDRAHRCKGYCGLHYDRVRKHGTTELPVRQEEPCTSDGCGRKAICRGYCKAHYDRIRLWGNPRDDIPLKDMPTYDERADIVSRILRRCKRTQTGCVEYTGYGIPSGYGTISWESKTWVVHRAMWTAVVGPIPDDDDWTIDHLCFNRRCVNVGHLEVVTRAENSERGGGLHRALLNRLNDREERTHCHRGHCLAEVGVYQLGNGGIKCRECSRQDWQKSSARQNRMRKSRYHAKRDAGVSWTEARLA